MKRIAILAPETPALSATFVYNELLGLIQCGCQITPISVHVPKAPAEEQKAQELKETVHYLYQEGILLFMWANLLCLLFAPWRYLKTLSLLYKDISCVGLFNRVGLGLLFRFIAASRVAKILQSNNCHHLHVHFAHIPTDIAMYASSFSGIPFSFTAHANDLFQHCWLLKEKVDRASFAVTISEYNERYMQERTGLARKIHVVRCAPDASLFFPRPFSPPASPYSIGTLGRMVKKKGFDILVKACYELDTANFPFHLEIAGNGPLEQDLKKMTTELGLQKKISFIGSLEHNNVPAWLKTLDCFVLPCQIDRNGDMDGIPVVLMEAMLSGVPVVATKVSGIPELVDNDISGLLVESGNPESLAYAVQRLVTDGKLYMEVVKNAQKKINEEFDQHHNVKKLFGLLDANCGAG